MSVKPSIFKLPKSSFSTYEIPERYRNTFYLANAALFDQINWFLHRAYEISFPSLVSKLKDQKVTDEDAVAKVLNVIEVLDQCNSIIDVRFPIQRENGKKEIIRGFRAQYGLFSGFNTSLGGLRIQEDITRDQIKAFAALSNYKHACMGIRLAGGHGGIKVNPKNYTSLEMQRIVKKYAGELYLKGFCDGRTDIVEPDLNVGEREMEWIAEIFPEGHEKNMVAGKSVAKNGIENYSKMASQGVFFALDHFVNKESIREMVNLPPGGLDQKTFIIQGLGKLGSDVAKFLESSGAICVGIKDHDAYIYDATGINLKAVIDHKTEHGSIQTFFNAKPRTNDEIFNNNCDILILAAQQKTIKCHTADKIQAKIIVEAANGGITPTAHRILVARSKLVLPDIYVSSGHAIASYLEYLLSLKDANCQIPVIRRLYANILDSFDLSEKSCQMVSSATTQKIISCHMAHDVLTYAIDHVMKETGDELLEIIKDFGLKMDLRIAGYIKAIQSIHDSIYNLKRY